MKRTHPRPVRRHYCPGAGRCLFSSSSRYAMLGYPGARELRRGRPARATGKRSPGCRYGGGREEWATWPCTPGTAGGRAIPALMTAERRSAPRTTQGGLRPLQDSCQGDSAVPPLCDGLRTSVLGSGCSALLCLAGMGSESSGSYPDLGEAVKDKKIRASFSVGNQYAQLASWRAACGPWRPSKPCRSCSNCGDDDHIVLDVAIRALGQSFRPHSLPALMLILQYESTPAASTPRRQLGGNGSESQEAVPTLRQM